MTAIVLSSRLQTRWHSESRGSEPAPDPRATAKRTPDAWSDERLVEAFTQHGSEHHFRALLARHKTRVHQVALSVLGPHQAAQAEDVAQEVFIRLYQRLDQFRGKSSFSTWLYRLTYNAAIDHRRSSIRHSGLPFDESTLPADLASPAPESSRAGVNAAIQKALWRLPESQRMIVHLYYWLGLKLREIAEVLECPEGTVKVYLQRAKASLSQFLEGYSDER